MKAINAIIERLRQKYGLLNGCYYLLQTKVDDFQKAIAVFEAAAYESAGSWFRKSEAVTEKHSILDGFIYGLYSANFITDAEKDQAFKELNDLRWPPKKEEAAPAGTETTSNASTNANVTPDAPDVKGGTGDG